MPGSLSNGGQFDGYDPQAVKSAQQPLKGSPPSVATPEEAKELARQFQGTHRPEF